MSMKLMAGTTHSDEFLRRVDALLAELGIAREQFAHRPLPLFREPAHLVVVETDAEGRAHWLIPEATAAWHQLSAAAVQDGVRLVLVSAFRNLQQQAEIIRWKLSRGLSIEAILLGSAPPGYSEHHTGRAVDISSPGCPPWEEAFEHTEAYQWLSRYAGSFGFSLSFPRGNPYEYVFEPWHWCHEEVARKII
jgi:D-alanyl-D-alanine carboxypeptidase